MTLTQEELLVACGGVCWGFNIKFKIDPATGKEIFVDQNKSNSLLIIKPDPYSLAFEPRSHERKQEIIDNWTEAEKIDTEKRAKFIRDNQVSPTLSEKI